MSDDLISRKALIETLKGQYENARKMRYSGNSQFYEYWAGRMDSYRDAIKIVEKAELVPDQADAGGIQGMREDAHKMRVDK